MILVDTSVWVQHLRSGDDRLVRLLEAGSVLVHPWVHGELALGHLRAGSEVLDLLPRLPQAEVASATEVLVLIAAHQLQGCGIGYVDTQLLAAVRLTPGARLWSHDRQLSAVAARLGDAHVA